MAGSQFLLKRTVILKRSGSRTTVAHAVGVQKVRPVNREVSRSHCSETATDIYLKMWILTGVVVFPALSGNIQGRCEFFLSLDGVSERNREI